MPPHSQKKRLKTQFILVLLLCLLSIALPGAQGHFSAQSLQPRLAYLAKTDAEAIVPVIVQLHQNSGAISDQLAQIGGTITKDLRMINSIVAELPAGQLPTLALLPAVRWVSLDAPVIKSGCNNCLPADKLRTVYNQAIRVDEVWNKPPYLRGAGIGVAVVDSGIQASHPDFPGKIVGGNSSVLGPKGRDDYGHGTFVAGIIGGDDPSGKRRYIGVAPESNLLDVKVTTITGASTESDVVEGLQWIYENHEIYNIRVVNISLNASNAQSYHTSPLAAASEILWFNGIVVVTSAGNHGEGAIYPPANDPFVITVGAVDDQGTAELDDDVVAHFSAYGKTTDGYAKPDLVAPGRHLVAPMANETALLPTLRPEMVEEDRYMRMSGTSFSAPIVSGAIALLLQDEPELTPDQVKYRLMATANRTWPGYKANQAGAGYLDVAAAIHGRTDQSANTNLPVSRLLTSGQHGLGGLISSLLGINWDSVSWSTVSWSTVSWSTVSWSTVSWSSDYIETEEEKKVDDSSGSLLSGLLFRSAADSSLSEQPVEETADMEGSEMADDVTAPTNLLFLPFIMSGD